MGGCIGCSGYSGIGSGIGRIGGIPNGIIPGNGGIICHGLTNGL
ncbi:hypothetical protein P9302_20270 [Brevibacillus agri]|nr:hypothetical protein [Brevibacillus agri]